MASQPRVAILLSGAMGAGKDASADILREPSFGSFRRFALADAIRTFALELLHTVLAYHPIECTRPLTWDTFADPAVKNEPLFFVKSDKTITPLRMPFKITFLSMLHTFTHQTFDKDSENEAASKVLGAFFSKTFLDLVLKITQADAPMCLALEDKPLTPRWLLQWLGTNVCRDVLSKDVWINAATRQLAVFDWDRVVLTDVRFANEAELLKKALQDTGHKVLHVRLNTNAQLLPCAESSKSPLHASEAEIPSLKVDAELYNDKTLGLEVLKSAWKELLALKSILN